MALKRAFLFTTLGAIALALSISWVSLLQAADSQQATATAPNTVTSTTIIDDFNDGDASDWTFFGGDNAGGGGGVADDRPYEGSHYFSTGWGAGAPSGGFFGGAFRNFDNAAQPVPPADAQFSVWVYNQSNANSDGYTLEITIREDLDGNGWSDGVEESFRLDTVFTSADYNDGWVEITAPLSDFTQVAGAGGDGTFNGNLDEIVIVIAGVPNADNGTTVEVDFDQFAFIEGTPPPSSSAIIDDFNDGDVADWTFFGGDNAGGGGGAADDRPYEGSHYFSTGWGSGGPSNGFFGGAFKNFDNAAQPVPPMDAQFSVWVYNQSDATSDGYTLEITLREDVEGDGWNGGGGTDESFRLDTSFTSAEYDDQWVQITAPLTDFTLVDGAGDGTFNGNLDEIVIVVAGVVNADSTTVEVDFDLFAFTEGTPPPPPTAEFPMIADFEGGLPSDWFQYGDGGTTVTPEVVTVADTDGYALPGQIGNNDILSVTANVPTWAGFGAALDPVQNWSDYDALSFWFYGDNAGTTYTVEIQTVQGDDRRATFVEDFMGWQQIILPFNTFGAGGSYDVSQVDNWVFVLDGVNDTFKLDNIQLVNLQSFADFEGGLPADWFQYGDGGTTVIPTVATISDTGSLALPGQVGNNDILSVTADVPTWAGFGAAFNPVQNWNDYQGVGFWFYGTNISTTHEFEIQTASGDDRRATFVDDFMGWRYITLPFNTFGTPPYDVSAVDNWVFVLDGTTGNFAMDDIAIYGDAAVIPVRIQFDPNSYTVTEGETATISVTLNVTSTDAVTVSYATMDDTAVAGTHYTATTGTLTFAPDSQIQTFTVETIDNNDSEADKALSVILSDPVGAELGTNSEATLTIEDDEVTNICSARSEMVDNFENGLPTGVDGDGNAIGFFTFQDPSPNTTVTFTTNLVNDADSLALPGQSGDNNLYQVDVNVASYAGTTHAFENIPVDTWTPQDWSSYEGISFWFYGQNTGTVLGFEIQDNRNPGSTGTDTEIWNYTFIDDFEGWQKFELRFSEFNRKEIGNGAPNDGLGLEEVHAWAFLALETGGADVTYYMDNVQVCGVASDKPLSIGFESGRYEADEGETAILTVELSKPHTETVTIEYATAEATASEDRQYTPR